ncbi:MAG: hypothetical protein KAT48_05005 [Bacteroidales bacterium]|nr:hypothetical protein [Bacteroidales bacterium]
MKPMFISFLCLILLSASTCKKEGVDCHHDLIVLNNSNDTIICAIKSYYDNLCKIDGPELKPNQSYTFNLLRTCWEEELSNGQKQEFYIVDPANYNIPGVFYDCDSIEIKNTVLKHYELTLQDLQNANWTVTYP